MIGTARAPGTCGELVQGKINGVNFLVTCPVNMYSYVTVRLNKSGRVTADAGLPKVRTAVEKVLRLLDGRETGAEVLVSSLIPQGKGMASSSADIAAACAAAAVATGTLLSPREIAEIALSIEPTDGIMFPGIVMFDHVAGRVCQSLGRAPAMEILIIDLGGTVDTLAFNANSELDMLNRAKERRTAAALDKIKRGLAAGDCLLIGEAATEAALANQQILYKAELDQLIELNKRLGGLGVNVAHSGTVVGLFFETGRVGPAMSALAGAGFNCAFRTMLTNGGIEVLQERAGDKIWMPLDTYTAETSGRLRRNTG